MPYDNKIFAWRRITIVSLFAGIAYCSWPLGPWLNPIVANRGMASELAVKGQPYYWIFMYGDVFSAFLMLTVIYNIWRRYLSNNFSRSARLSLLAMGIFCISASIAALCPLQCISALRHCPTFTNNPLTLIHGITSVLAGVGLFFALMCLIRLQPRNKLLGAQLLLFCTSGGWAIITLFITGESILSQNIFISVCSLCIAAYPWQFSVANKLVLTN